MMSAPEMVLVDGTYYTKADLAAKLEREEAAAARVKAEADRLAEAMDGGGVGVTISAEALEQVVSPLVERIENLEKRLADAGSGAEGVGVPDVAGSGADEAAGAGSGDAEAVKPAAKAKKAVK